MFWLDDITSGSRGVILTFQMKNFLIGRLINAVIEWTKTVHVVIYMPVYVQEWALLSKFLMMSLFHGRHRALPSVLVSHWRQITVHPLHVSRRCIRRCMTDCQGNQSKVMLIFRGAHRNVRLTAWKTLIIQCHHNMRTPQEGWCLEAVVMYFVYYQWFVTDWHCLLYWRSSKKQLPAAISYVKISCTISRKFET